MSEETLPGEEVTGKMRKANLQPTMPEEEKQAEEEKKIEIIADTSLRNATFIFKEEDHTLGNSLRYMLNKHTSVEFAGYTIPHPSIPKMHLRVQTNGMPAVQALDESLSRLIAVGEHMSKVFNEALIAFENSS